MASSNPISLNILSSHCWIDPSSHPTTCFSEQLQQQTDFNPIQLKQIPAIKRRRLNGLSKMAMHTSLACLEKAGSNVDADNVVTVFASRHGELNRTIKIIRSMMDSQEISPKDFSLSVHNSALGLFSIFTNNKLASTSIAAGSNTFGFALVEAYNYLKRFPQHQVLLTCFDLEVSKPFNQFLGTNGPSYSCSLLLTLESNQGQSLSFNFNKVEQEQAPKPPLALDFYEFLQSPRSQQTLKSQNTRWEFIKDVS